MKYFYPTVQESLVGKRLNERNKAGRAKTAKH